MSVFEFDRKSTAALILTELSLDDTLIDVSNDTITFIMKKNQTDPDSYAAIAGTLNVADYGIDSKAYVVLVPEETDITIGRYHLTVKWVTDSGAVYYPFVGYSICNQIDFI